MAKRVFIGVGHGGSDPGAAKYVVEKEANLVMALETKRILEANGVDVGISRTNDVTEDLADRIKEANAFAPDLAVDVHNNAGGGNGWEAIVQTNRYSEESRKAATAIEKRVKEIGQESRGLKTKLNSSGTADYFGFLRQTNAPALILEGFFVDNRSDAKDFDTVSEQKEMGRAYALGIMDHLGIAGKEATAAPKEPEHWYRVRKSWDDAESQLGAFKSLENAKTACPGGYTVYDWNGNAVYSRPQAKTNEQIADEVIAGKWGNGDERKRRLNDAGYDPEVIQTIVNRKYRD